MQINKEMLNSYEMQIKAEVGAEETNTKIKEKYDYLQKNVEIKGFRKGKAPLALLKNRLDKEFWTEFSKELAEEYVNSYTKENNIERLSKIDIKEYSLEEGKPFTFTAVFHVKPEIEVTEDKYKGIDLVKRSETASSEEIDAILNGYRAQKAVNVPFDGPVDGDTLVYGSLYIQSLEDEGNTLSKEDFSIAKGTYIIGEEIFDDLIGKNVNDIFEKELNFHSAFFSFSPSEKVKVRYEIKGLKKQELPPLNNDLAKQVDENLNTLEDLKNKIIEDIEARKKNLNHQKLYADINKHLLNEINVEVPPALVEIEFYRLLSRYQEQMKAYNIGFKDQEEHDAFLEMRKQDARKIALTNLITSAIIEKESIDADFSEVKTRINELVEGSKDPSEQRKEYMKDEKFNIIKDNIKLEKLYAFIIDNARITEETGDGPEDQKTIEE